MSLNPQLDSSREPLRNEGEYFILKRTDCEFGLSTQNKGKLKAKGSLVITSTRLILINKDQSNITFNSCEIPLISIFGETYNQPFFGRPKILGNCHALPNSILGRISFIILFSDKHCSTVVSSLFGLLDSLRSNQNCGHSPKIIQAFESYQFNSVFPIDINDPSIIYQVQPEVSSLKRQVSQSAIMNRGDNMMISDYDNKNQNVMNSMVQGKYNNNELGFQNNMNINNGVFNKYNQNLNKEDNLIEETISCNYNNNYIQSNLNNEKNLISINIPRNNNNDKSNDFINPYNRNKNILNNINVNSEGNSIQLQAQGFVAASQNNNLSPFLQQECSLRNPYMNNAQILPSQNSNNPIYEPNNPYPSFSSLLDVNPYNSNQQNSSDNASIGKGKNYGSGFGSNNDQNLKEPLILP